MKIKMIAFALLTTVMLWSCSDDDPKLQGVAFKMKATTTSSTISPNGRGMNSTYTFKEARVGVSQVEFEHDDDDDSGNDFEIEFKGKYLVDLIAGTSNPEFGVSTIAPGVYDEVEVKLGKFLEGGNSVFVSFTYQPDGGDPIQVEFSTKAELEIEIEYSNGFTIQPDVLSTVLVLLDLDELLASVDLSEANMDEDGVIRINQNSNANLAQLIVSNFDDACKSGYDNDDDDEFDDDDD